MSILRANAKALRASREAAGYSTPRAAAQKIGCTTRYLVKLESGRNIPVSEDLLRRVAAVYACAPADLLSPMPVVQDVQINPGALRRRRNKHGYSLQDLADLSGILFSTLWRWEQEPALTRFDFNLIHRAAAALDCSVAELTCPIERKDAA